MADLWKKSRAQDVIATLSPTLWLDASRMPASASGTPLFSWTDISGNNRHPIQPASSQRPKNYSGVQNGKPGIKWVNGLQQYFYIPNSTSAFKTYYSAQGTVFIVAKPGTGTNTDAQYAFCSQGGSNSNTGFTCAAENRSAASAFGSHRLSCGAYNGSGSTLAFGSNASWADNSALENTLAIWGIQIDAANATPASRLTITKNASTVYTGNTNSGAVNTGNSTYNLYIGTQISSAGVPTLYYENYIFEMIFIPSLLSGANMTSMFAYLNAKWGVY